ncbi:hypothetical protein BS732_4185 [Bacillus subtilis MB73/2]|nr:hypothetical protein BS732_4185 [Bacillus subtilis MB73/2]
MPIIEFSAIDHKVEEMNKQRPLKYDILCIDIHSQLKL